MDKRFYSMIDNYVHFVRTLCLKSVKQTLTIVGTCRAEKQKTKLKKFRVSVANIMIVHACHST